MSCFIFASNYLCFRILLIMLMSLITFFRPQRCNRSFAFCLKQFFKFFIPKPEAVDWISNRTLLMGPRTLNTGLWTYNFGSFSSADLRKPAFFLYNFLTMQISKVLQWQILMIRLKEIKKISKRPPISPSQSNKENTFLYIRFLSKFIS